mmetsp:Transcript_39263/g.59930  ORF Transcript_39263/g.59930 Transcript_39263/m.59930 type:complete len:109 (+) Transcript_39263:883-1209(+)
MPLEQPKAFQDFVDYCLAGQRKFWKGLISIERTKTCPIYYLKYEELTKEPQRVLTEVFEFLLGVESIEGTFVAKRIEEVLAKGKEATHLYTMKPKAKYSKGIDMFNPT